MLSKLFDHHLSEISRIDLLVIDRHIRRSCWPTAFDGSRTGCAASRSWPNSVGNAVTHELRVLHQRSDENRIAGDSPNTETSKFQTGVARLADVSKKEEP
jgi:hypothetical protein